MNLRYNYIKFVTLNDVQNQLFHTYVIGGIHHICIEVNDIEEAVRQLKVNSIL